MHALSCLVTLIATATVAMAAALPGGGPGGYNPPENANSPSCGGDQAVCCTGSYTAEGELVDNCVTYTPQNSVCSTNSNVYCCYTCTEAAGSCVGCVHFY